MMQEHKLDFITLKSEIQVLEKSDFNLIKSETDRLGSELEKLRDLLREEIGRALAGVRLDLNLERGRLRDEASMQEIRIKEAEAKVAMELETLRTQLEAVKFQILQYMLGTITGAGALLLGKFISLCFALTSYKKKAYLRMFK